MGFSIQNHPAIGDFRIKGLRWTIETVLQNMNKYDPFATEKSNFFWGAKVHLLAHEG